MEKPFQAPAILNVGAPTKDGGMRGRFETNKLLDEEKLNLLSYDGKFGYIMFSPNQFTLDDLPKEQAEDKNKTPSKRLRASLFILWKQNGEVGDFETFYRERMEKLIKFIQEKLD
jgi:hypothetical protein